MHNKKKKNKKFKTNKKKQFKDNNTLKNYKIKKIMI